MKTMKYVNIPAVKTVEVKEMEKPIPAEGEALIKVLYGGICGSDMGTYKGTFIYSSFPRIPGHEFSAEVISAPENEAGIKEGMIVTGNPYYNCGTCYSCQRGLVNCCTSNETLGAQRDGIFRQYFTIPVERLYDGMGLDSRTLALIEPFCISYHAIKRAQVNKNDKVLVVGSGPIGVLAVMGAKLKGAEVTVSDLSENRLAKAREIGADHVIVTGKEDLKGRTDEITNGNGFDVCIECAGLPITFQNCIDMAAFRGRVVVVGIGKESLDFTYSQIQTKELDIFGSRNAHKEEFMELIEMAAAGRFELKKMISKVYPLDEAADAFRDLSANPDSMMKVLIDFSR